MTTPAELGYRMPAQWEPHAATWLSWPHNRQTWPGQFEPIPHVWAQLTRVLAEFEPVNILAGGEAVMDEARRLVGDVPGVSLLDVPTNDAWIRDHGPMFLAGNAQAEPALVDWRYNAWGGKYPPFDSDNRVPGRIAELLGFRRFCAEIVLEGGAVDFNGRGTALSTETCLLNENRNPGLSPQALARYLADYCGVGHVVWLGAGIAGDDTDGHVDQLARFVGPRTVVAAVEPDPADENHAPLQDNFRRLQSATDQQGQPLEVIGLPMPDAVYYDNHRLPASYLNFYVANGVVIVPQFDCAADRTALDTLRRLFPGRQVRGLRSIELIWGLGAVNCITQQQPDVLRTL